MYLWRENACLLLSQETREFKEKLMFFSLCVTFLYEETKKSKIDALSRCCGARAVVSFADRILCSNNDSQVC